MEKDKKKEKKKRNLNTVKHSIKKKKNWKDRQCIDCYKRKTEHFFELCEL